MKIVNADSVYHWGRWIVADSPAGGVVAVHSLSEWFWDSIDTLGINITEEEVLEEWDRDNPGEDFDWDGAYLEECTYILGDWEKDTNSGQYTESGNQFGFSAVVTTLGGAYNVHIVASKYARRGALGSPCIPGQIDLDSPGDYLAFDLPPSYYGDQWSPLWTRYVQSNGEGKEWIALPPTKYSRGFGILRRLQNHAARIPFPVSRSIWSN